MQKQFSEYFVQQDFYFMFLGLERFLDKKLSFAPISFKFGSAYGWKDTKKKNVAKKMS